jgi:hypothetical protein
MYKLGDGKEHVRSRLDEIGLYEQHDETSARVMLVMLFQNGDDTLTHSCRKLLRILTNQKKANNVAAALRSPNPNDRLMRSSIELPLNPVLRLYRAVAVLTTPDIETQAVLVKRGAMLSLQQHHQRNGEIIIFRKDGSVGIYKYAWKRGALMPISKTASLYTDPARVNWQSHLI